ncbi:MAG TPA: C4-type zinc ribbon domain-containing protein [Terriglobales bacterium]|nr:C4-type zinc ribbon domain-containing protein [Terriglobales bacterium]
MVSDIEKLLHLQQADREIRRLNDEVAALPKRVLAIEQKLAGTQAILEKAKASVKADEAARRKYEAAIQELQTKISKYRDQSLDVKTNEQYKALLGEIQFAEQEIRANEDKILELMVNAESREKEVKAAEAELKQETAEIEKEKADARQRTAEDEKQLAEWNAKRDQLRQGIAPDLLRQFERVSHFRGSGIAEVRDHKCMGCQVMLRPQTYNEVRSGKEVVSCDSCQRILYFDPANEKEEERVVTPARRRARPKSDAPQAWYFRGDFGQHGEVLIGFINEGSMASRRVYDSHTGRMVGDILMREGNYRLAFPEDLTESSIRLNGHWDLETIEEWGSEMPSDVLDALNADLRAAQHDLRATHKSNAASAVASEHPAAS